MRIRPEEVVSKSFTLCLSRVEHRVTGNIDASDQLTPIKLVLRAGKQRVHDLLCMA